MALVSEADCGRQLQEGWISHYRSRQRESEPMCRTAGMIWVGGGEGRGGVVSLDRAARREGHCVPRWMSERGEVVWVIDGGREDGESVDGEVGERMQS